MTGVKNKSTAKRFSEKIREMINLIWREDLSDKKK